MVLLAATVMLSVACGDGRTAQLDSVDMVDASVATPTADGAKQGSVLAAARVATARDALKLTERAGAWTATHHAQGFSTRIGREGASLESLSEGWRLGLHVAQVGRAGVMQIVTSAQPIAQGERVEIPRAAGVREWFAHDSRGLEHGVDVDARPPGDELSVSVRTCYRLAGSPRYEAPKKCL